MSNHKFPSFNFPYAPSEDLRQFLVDYGRTGLVHVFKDGQNVECIPQKKEMNENRIVRLISSKPTLPLNLPGKFSGELNRDFRMEFEQPVTNLISDHGGIVFGGLAELAGAEAAKASWSTPPSMPFLKNTNPGKTLLDPVLKRFENDFCDVPLGLLTDLVQESCQEDKVTITGKYYGNCLACTQTQESGIVLIYPGGTTMSELCFSDLEINSPDEGSLSARLSAIKGSFSLPERICQINTGNDIDQSCVIAVRTEHRCWLFKNGSCPSQQKPTFLGNLECKTRPCGITVSPYIPEEVVVAMESGSLWLWNAEDRSVQVVRQCSACTPKDFDWYFSEFGSHPRQVVRGTQTNVELIDLRGNSTTSQDLMTLPSPHFFSDKFTAIQRNHDNPYHYLLATTQSLVIMDERFQQNPVLKWSHSLEYPPKYINVLPDPASQDMLVFVGSYESHEITCFQYCYSENWSYPLGMVDDAAGVLPPRATLTPWKISSYSEWPEMVDYQNKAQSNPKVTQRLNQPLRGLACIQSSTTALNILQLSNVGDLFYQSLLPRESKLTEVRDEGRVLFYEAPDLDLTSSGGCGSRKQNLGKDEEFITKWVKCLMEHVDQENKVLLEELGESCHTEDVGLIREHLLFSSVEMVAECRLCCGEDYMNSSCSSDDAGEECPHCGLGRELADQLHEVRITQGRVLTKEYLGLSHEPESLEMFDLGMQCSKPLGNTLLKNWTSNDQVSIVLTEEQEDTTTDVKQDAVKTWLETGEVTEKGEDGKSPLKKKCLVTSPSQQTAIKEEHTTFGGIPRNLNQEFVSAETKTLSPNKNSLGKSPRTPKTTADSNRAFQGTKFGSPYPSQDSQVISSQIKFKNQNTPDSKLFPESQTYEKRTPTLVNVASPRTSVQSRTPTKKKGARVPGF